MLCKTRILPSVSSDQYLHARVPLSRDPSIVKKVLPNNRVMRTIAQIENEIVDLILFEENSL